MTYDFRERLTVVMAEARTQPPEWEAGKIVQLDDGWAAVLANFPSMYVAGMFVGRKAGAADIAANASLAYDPESALIVIEDCAAASPKTFHVGRAAESAPLGIEAVYFHLNR